MTVSRRHLIKSSACLAISPSLSFYPLSASAQVMEVIGAAVSIAVNVSTIYKNLNSPNKNLQEMVALNSSTLERIVDSIEKIRGSISEISTKLDSLHDLVKETPERTYETFYSRETEVAVLMFARLLREFGHNREALQEALLNDDLDNMLRKLLVNFSAYGLVSDTPAACALTKVYLHRAMLVSVDQQSFSNMCTEEMKTLLRIKSKIEARKSTQEELVEGLVVRNDRVRESVRSRVNNAPNHVECYGFHHAPTGTVLWDRLNIDVKSLPDTDLQKQMDDLMLSKYQVIRNGFTLRRLEIVYEPSTLDHNKTKFSTGYRNGIKGECEISFDPSTSSNIPGDKDTVEKRFTFLASLGENPRSEPLLDSLYKAALSDSKSLVASTRSYITLAAFLHCVEDTIEWVSFYQSGYSTDTKINEFGAERN